MSASIVQLTASSAFIWILRTIHEFFSHWWYQSGRMVCCAVSGVAVLNQPQIVFSERYLMVKSPANTICLWQLTNLIVFSHNRLRQFLIYCQLSYTNRILTLGAPVSMGPYM